MKAMQPETNYQHILRELYETAKAVPPGYALNMVRQARTDEERNFFAYICDMNIQREQRKAIENNVF